MNAAALASGDQNIAPNEGDLSVCFGCGEVLTFDARLRLQRISPAVLAKFHPEEAAQLRQTQSRVRAFLAAKPVA
jgi:hypothetical protein